MLHYALLAGLSVGALLAWPASLTSEPPMLVIKVLSPSQQATAPLPASSPDQPGRSQTDTPVTEAGLATATAVAKARLAELDAGIAREAQDVAALSKDRQDLQAYISELSDQTLEANRHLSKLVGSVPPGESAGQGQRRLDSVGAPEPTVQR